jgi:hypothetical protein
MAQQPPSGPGPPHYRGFTITLGHTPHSVGLLWTSDQPDTETSTCQYITLTRDRHPYLSGIRTRNPSKRSTVDQRLRPHGHSDRLCVLLVPRISIYLLFPYIDHQMLDASIEGGS